MKAYHFLRDNMTSGSGNEPAWTVGEERTHQGKLRMCVSGYHSSPSWYDALGYAPGPVACVVEISGEIIKDVDKYVAQRRKLIDCRDATRVLRVFACDCAERALKQAKITDERSWKTIDVARRYAAGEATDEELDAAWAAARVTRDAARAAAWVTRDTARVAAWATAYAVAWAAAYAAARDARDAAWAASDAAEIRWQRRHLNKLMKELFEERS